MERDYLITRLKRIFDQCVRVQEEGNEQNVGKVIVNEFNTLLDELQEAYPENQIVQDLGPVELTGAGGPQRTKQATPTRYRAGSDECLLRS